MISNVNINFQGNNRYAYCRDGSVYRIKSMYFEAPLTLDDAISEIRADNTMMDMLCGYRYFGRKTLQNIQSGLYKNPNLQNLKVKSLFDYGQTALVFETENDEILKITNRDHFLGRKIEKFDLPIKKSGKLSNSSFCYYYFEDKISPLSGNDNIFKFVQNIKKLGFKIVDYRLDQFGKDKDGNIFLLDPECAIKHSLFGLIKHKLLKIKSYILMAK